MSKFLHLNSRLPVIGQPEESVCFFFGVFLTSCCHGLNVLSTFFCELSSLHENLTWSECFVLCICKYLPGCGRQKKNLIEFQNLWVAVHAYGTQPVCHVVGKGIRGESKVGITTLLNFLFVPWDMAMELWGICADHASITMLNYKSNTCTKDCWLKD